MQGQMWTYILKRILLMIPTLLGVLTLTFAVVQFVPGGPVEQMMLELKGKGDAAVSGAINGLRRRDAGGAQREFLCDSEPLAADYMVRPRSQSRFIWGF